MEARWLQDQDWYWTQAHNRRKEQMKMFLTVFDLCKFEQCV